MAGLKTTYDPALVSRPQVDTIMAQGKSTVWPGKFLKVPGLDGNREPDWYVGGVVETFSSTNYHRLGIRKGYLLRNAPDSQPRRYFAMDLPLPILPKFIEYVLATAFYDEAIREVILGQLFQDSNFQRLISALQKKSTDDAERMLVEAAEECERDQRMSGNEDDENVPWTTFCARS
jgi:hypothetical protein